MYKLLDTHAHLMYPDHLSYTWTNDIEALSPPDFSYKKYIQLAKSGGVTRCIFMEVGVDDDDYQAETRKINDLVTADGGTLDGIIASCRPEDEHGFDDWLAQCNNLQVSGFRRILHVVPDDVSISTIFRNNVRKIGDAGLAFDICMLESQLSLAVELANHCDNTTFVLNHCGVPDITSGDFNTWASAIEKAAECPNMNIKVSGISAYCEQGESTLEKLQPYMDHVLAAFGDERVVWGSDYPVVNMGDGLTKWLEITQSWLAKLPESSAEKIASANAARIYKIS